MIEVGDETDEEETGDASGPVLTEKELEGAARFWAISAKDGKEVSVVPPWSHRDAGIELIFTSRQGRVQRPVTSVFAADPMLGRLTESKKQATTAFSACTFFPLSPHPVHQLTWI